jgi:pimeloyl-ACP methyl ester carboxylesterase
MKASTARSNLVYNPAPGCLVDVGGYRLHLNCSGHGSPVVVLDAGLGDSCLVWQTVQEQLTAYGRVCSYDRAGYGWSENGPKPRSFQQAAEELQVLLKNAGEKGPFILVGHSVGANTVRLFAAAFPQEVAGMVLVEPPLFTEASPILVGGLRVMRVGLKILSRLGIIRLLGARSKMNLLFGGAFPPPALSERAGFLYRPAAIQTSIAEIEALPETIRALNGSSDPGAWRNWPVVIISANKGNQPDPEVSRRLEALARLSTNGRIQRVEGSHFFHFEHPEVVVQAIREMIIG